MVHHKGLRAGTLSSHTLWLVGQAVKTPASHAGNGGSIPPRVRVPDKEAGIEPARVGALRKCSGGTFLATSAAALKRKASKAKPLVDSLRSQRN